MGNYATIRVEGKIKEEHRGALRSLWESASLEDAFSQMFGSASTEEQSIVLAFLGMDRARFTLRGSLAYAPLDWAKEEPKAFKVAEDGYHLWLSSSKNAATQRFFLDNVVPILYEEGYRADLTGLR